MLGKLKRALPLGLALAVFSVNDAVAATINVSITNFAFTPKTAAVAMGSTVHWSNDSTAFHSATGNAPLSLWDSGTLHPGDTYDFLFTAGGKYRYFCTFHPVSMTGVASVKIRATPPSGPAGTLFTITVATIDAPTDFVYDVQKMDPGGAFQDWMLGVTTKTVVFDSTGQPAGTYSFRSRLHRISNDATSLYSAPKAVIVS